MSWTPPAKPVNWQDLPTTSTALDAANLNAGEAYGATVGASVISWLQATAPVNVKQQGAVGDGDTDDTTAVKAADVLAGTGGVLYFPPGTYKLTTLGTTYSVVASWVGAGNGQSTIVCPDIAAPLKWTGSVGGQINLAADLLEGALTATLTTGGGASFAAGNSVIFQTTASNDYGAWVTHVASVAGDVLTLQESCPAIFTTANTSYAQKITPMVRPMVKDLAIIGPTSPATLSIIVTFNYIEGGTLEGLRFANSLDVGVAMFGCYGTALRNVSHSEILANNTALGIQVFKSSKIEVTGGESHHSSNGLECQGMTRSTIHGLRITDANTSGGRGIKLLFASNYNTVTACKIATNDPTHTGIHVDDSWSNVISSNELDNIGANAINLTSSLATGNQTHHTIIIGNQIRNCQSAGIHLGTGTNAVDTFNVVVGNVISNNGGNGIETATNSNVIVGNVIDGIASTFSGVTAISNAINNLVLGNIINSGAQNALLNATGLANYWLYNFLKTGGTQIAGSNDTHLPVVRGSQLGYGATVTPDLRSGQYQVVPVTNGTAFTVAAPLKPSAYAQFTLEIFNNSGGAMGVITWDASLKMAGAFTNPANGKRRTITFGYSVAAGPSWVEISRAAADI